MIEINVVWREFERNNSRQIWTREVPYSSNLQNQSCFTLMNPDSGLYLTATGDNTLEIQVQEDQVQGRFGGGIFDFDSQHSCGGSLTMIHTALYQSRGLNPALEELQSMKTARLTGKRYFNLPRRILKNRKLLHIENVGDCCWQFNSQPRFRGVIEYAKTGFAGLPRRTPKSAGRILCDLVQT